MTPTPNHYQVAVLDWIVSGRGNAVVRACAGSGKTSTLEMAARRIAQLEGAEARDGLIVAFNVSIARAMATRLRGTPIKSRTMNSMGHRALLRKYPHVEVNEAKYKDRIFAAFQQASAGDYEGRQTRAHERRALRQSGWPVGETRRLVDLCRSSLSPKRAQFKLLADHFALDIEEEVEELIFDIARNVLESGWKDRNIVIDHMDQIWVPLMENLPMPRYDWLFIDECQDLSPAMIELAVRMLDPETGRAIAVGDPAQAIMGFAGADHQAFHNVKKRLEAKEFPLSICYRCPTSHLERAKAYVPDIEARPDAPDGLWTSATRVYMQKHVQPGDIILCRYKAPLLGACYELIAAGIRAGVRGRELAKPLVRTLDALERHVTPDLSDFIEVLESWQGQQRARLLRRKGDQSARVDELNDTVECLRAVFYAAPKIKTYADLANSLRSLFENQEPDVLLSTIHRAKGLEAPRVWILQPEDLASPGSEGSWHDQQERNIAYVAYTRSKQVLYEVTSS